MSNKEASDRVAQDLAKIQQGLARLLGELDKIGGRAAQTLNGSGIEGETPVPPGPIATTHEEAANILVSAGRIFGAAMRTARHMRMPSARAMVAANHCSIRHTGVDWLAEFDAHDLVESSAPRSSDPMFHMVEEHLAVIESFEMGDLIDDLALGERSNPALMRRVGQIARTLGWQPHRRRVVGASTFQTVWSPSIKP